MPDIVANPPMVLPHGFHTWKESCLPQIGPPSASIPAELDWPRRLATSHLLAGERPLGFWFRFRSDVSPQPGRKTPLPFRRPLTNLALGDDQLRRNRDMTRY